MMRSSRFLYQPVLACMFAALISIGAYIAIPVPGSPVPIVLQNLFIMLAALFLEPTWCLLAAMLYLALGALGLPVFSGGRGGIAHFFGPTGGFLLAYIPAVLLISWFSRIGNRAWWKTFIALIIGTLVIYGIGIPWLKITLNVTWTKAIAIGLFPFLFFDIFKIALAIPLSERIIPWLFEITGKEIVDRS